MIGGSDDHLFWRARDNTGARSGLSEGVDDSLRDALVGWLLRGGTAWSDTALDTVFTVPSGGAELAGLIVTALGAAVQTARPRFGEWLGDAPVPRIAGETVIDWPAQRWQFGLIKGGYGVWDSLAPAAPVRRIVSGNPEELLDDAAWALVLDPIVRGTRLEAEVYGCRVVPRVDPEYPLPPEMPADPAALLVHFDDTRGLMSSFACGRHIETHTYGPIGTQLLVKELDARTGAQRSVGVAVRDRITLQRAAYEMSGCVQKSPWVMHAAGGDRSLPALATWAGSL